MNTPYRIPTPPSMPRTRYKWTVRRVGDDVGESYAGVLVLLALAIGLCFIVSGTAPYVLRALLVWAFFALVWCLAFVRRKPITETNS